MTIHRIEQGKSELLSRVQHCVDELPRGLSRANQSLKRFVKSRPLVASFAALAAGFLAARVLARR
jgi:hypothetical protein